MADTQNPMKTREFLDEAGVNELSTRIFEKVQERMNTINEAENTLSSLALKFLAVEALMDVCREHTDRKDNPHEVTAAQLGLDKVENKTSTEILAELQVVSDSITGLMTPAMLQKLNNIPDAAMGLVVDSILSTSSTNPVQNKVVTGELNKKADLNPAFTEATTLEGIHSGDDMNIILGQMAKAITTLQDAVTRLTTAENNVTNLQTETTTINSTIVTNKEAADTALESVNTKITEVSTKVDTEVSNAVTEINKTIAEHAEDITNLNQAVQDVAVYDMIQQETSEDGYFSTYQMTKDGVPIGSKINIPKDYLVKGVSVKVVDTADTPYSGAVVGDKYVDWVINTTENSGNEQHLYIPVKDLMNPLSAANEAITITEDNAIGLKCVTANGLSIGSNGLQLDLVTETSNGAMSSSMLEKLNNAVPNALTINGVALNRNLTLEDLGIAPVDESGKVEVAKQADSATEAEHATNATNAENAKKAEAADTAASADEATKLAAPVNVSIAGVTEGSTSFDGSSNVTINLTDLTIPVVAEDPATPKEGQVWIRS